MSHDTSHVAPCAAADTPHVSLFWEVNYPLTPLLISISIIIIIIIIITTTTTHNDSHSNHAPPLTLPPPPHSRSLLPHSSYCLARFVVTFFLFLTGYVA
jgi:hypothetical protein